MTRFTFEGTTFEVPIEVYDWYNNGPKYVRLPDGRLLEIESWLESAPPKPMFKVIFAGEALKAEVVK